MRRAQPESAARRARGDARHHLQLTEAATWMPNGRLLGNVRITVDDAMYRALQRAPACVHSEFGNAYRWGRRFPADTYERIGHHDNDAAQTGLVDLDLLRAAPPQARGRMSEAVLDAFVGRHEWDHRPTLRALRRTMPWLVFIGATRGGDVGATLYVHRTAGRIDGVIIDNNCVFPLARR